MDSGYLIDKEFLPVRQLRIGDTGTLFDEKMGRYLLGPLICEGDSTYTQESFSENPGMFRIDELIVFCVLGLYENVVTFRLPDAGKTFFILRSNFIKEVVSMKHLCCLQRLRFLHQLYSILGTFTSSSRRPH